MPTRDFKSDYFRRLRSPSYAKDLLKIAFEESCADGNWRAFGLLLQDVIDAHGGKTEFAKKAKISRQHLYRLFRQNANPTLKTLFPLLATLGLKVTLVPEPERKKKAA